MKRKVWRVLLASALVLLASTAVVALAAVESEADTVGAVARSPIQNDDSSIDPASTQAAAAYTTIITVNTTVDTPGDTQSKTCYYTYSTWFATSDGQCNLRRALVEASHRPPADRPILVKFDLPLTDTNYYSDTQTWEIVMEAAYWEDGLIYNNVSEPDGYVTIDGDTQPGGRDNGYPKIIINSENSLTVLSENNTIRKLAFNGGGGIFLNSVTTGGGIGGYNTVESVWVGLHADGMEIVPTSNPNVTLAGGGIDIKSSHNVISDVIVTGSNIGIRNQTQGDWNVIRNSYIGTRGDTTIPEARLTCTASNVYNPEQWYGGWGIQFLGGSYNQVLSNTIAGVHSPHSSTETYPPAISTAGEANLFMNNVIGIDGADSEVGTCGQGFDVSGHNIQIRQNEIYGSRSSYIDGDTGDPTEGAIYINDSSPTARKVTVRNNVVRDSTTKVIEFGPSIPEALRLFDPPRIFIITGTLVVGETEVGSDCPNCLIELYLDDLDSGQDALELLTTAVVDDVAGTARFTATLDSPLPPNHGIRLTATTQDDYIIGDFLAGTTTRMSPAYGLDATYMHDLGPGWNLFSIDVAPTSSAITDVLSSLVGQYDLVLSFDGGPGGGGKTYDPGNPGASDLTTIDAAHGYWINITAPTTQTLTLDYEPVRNDMTITLYSGWNLVSYLPDVSWPVTKALESIAGDYDLVQGFDDGGKTYMPGFPAFSDLTEMEPGFAYWIKIKDLVPVTELSYPGYLAKRPIGARPPTMAGQGVSAADFFTPTTEWVDFYGVATLSGYSAPRNATILAHDPDGTVAGGFVIHTPPYYGFLHVYADDARTAGDEGADPGDEIRFTIDGRLADPSKSTTWTSRGDTTEVNLNVDIPFTATDVWSDFWGTLTIDGAPAPAGTIVAAYDPDGVYIGDYILDKTGQYGFLHAYGDDTTTLADEGAEVGDSVSFKAFLPLSTVPIILTPGGGSPTWQGRGSRTEVDLSGQYAEPGAPALVNILGPDIGETNKSYTFTIIVDPADVVLPITYTIEHTDLETPIEATLSTRAVYLRNRTWTTPGTKVITVTASNSVGSAVGTHTIEIVTIEPEVFTIGPAGGTAVFTDALGLRTIVEVPAGVLSETTTFTFTLTTELSHPAPTGFGFAGRGFELTASSEISGQITVTLEYRDQEWMDAGIEDETALRLYYWDEGASAWDDVANGCGTPPPTYGPDTVANVLAAPVCHLSDFTTLGPTPGGAIYLPLVLRSS
jgi:hypothetical protein